MAGSPLVEPSAPELRAHLRGVGTQLTETSELLVDIGTGAEVHRPHQVIESVRGEVACPVALEEHGPHTLALFVLCVPIRLEQITDSTDVRLVLAVAAILVFYLHHDDRATALDGQRSELLSHLLLEDLHALHEEWILLTQTDILLLQQPPGQSAHLPLGTDIGSRAHDDIHAVFLCQPAEGGHVVVACEVEVVLLWLMDVPEHVEAERIHAERFAHLDALLPIRTGDAGIVHLGGLDDERLSIEQKAAFAYGETIVDRCSAAQRGAE